MARKMNANRAQTAIVTHATNSMICVVLSPTCSMTAATISSWMRAQALRNSPMSILPEPSASAKAKSA